jgi:hypothetical protein
MWNKATSQETYWRLTGAGSRMVRAEPERDKRKFAPNNYLVTWRFAH